MPTNCLKKSVQSRLNENRNVTKQARYDAVLTCLCWSSKSIYISYSGLHFQHKYNRSLFGLNTEWATFRFLGMRTEISIYLLMAYSYKRLTDSKRLWTRIQTSRHAVSRAECCSLSLGRSSAYTKPARGNCMRQARFRAVGNVKVKYTSIWGIYHSLIVG
jgi:hypothetical protein